MNDALTFIGIAVTAAACVALGCAAGYRAGFTRGFHFGIDNVHAPRQASTAAADLDTYRVTPDRLTEAQGWTTGDLTVDDVPDQEDDQ